MKCWLKYAENRMDPHDQIIYFMIWHRGRACGVLLSYVLNQLRPHPLNLAYFYLSSMARFDLISLHTFSVRPIEMLHCCILTGR